MTAPKPLLPFTDDLDYMQAELAWVEARATRIAAERAAERDGVEDFSVRRRRPRVDDEPESRRSMLRRASRAGRQEEELRAALDARLAVHREADAPPLALDQLCATCGLDPFARTVLLLAAAPFFSGRYEKLYSAMIGAEPYESLTVEAAFAFAELSLAERIDRRASFTSRAPLIRQDLVSVAMHHRFSSAKDLLDSDINLANRTFAYLVGRKELEDEFQEFSSLEEPRAELAQVVLDERDKRRILSVVERHAEYLAARAEWGFDARIGYGRGSLMLFSGPSGTGKTMMAHAVAGHLGKRVLNVDIPTFLQSHEAGHFLPALFREARLQNALLFFDECESLFASRRHQGNHLMTLLLTELERFEGVAILATNLPEQLDEALMRRILVRVPFRKPDRSARARIWAGHLPAAAPIADDVDVEALAERFELTGGLIKNAVLAAVAAAVHDAGDAAPSITMALFEEAADGQLPRVDDDGNRIEVPAQRLADVVLSSVARAEVDELLSAVRNRILIQQRWGIGGTRSEQTGVAALLQGPPGTGKTLCAEALAGELRRPLVVGRGPAILSKWVGEAERNLARLFDRARADRAVILLDEADGLLSRRDDGRSSRHDLSLVNTLLDAIERYPGLVLLATNLPDRLDPALERRLGYRIAFERPDAAMRERLWEAFLPDTAPLSGPIDLQGLARYELTGALIRQAVLKAATRAAAADAGIMQATLEEAARAAGGLERRRRAVGFG